MVTSAEAANAGFFLPRVCSFTVTFFFSLLPSFSFFFFSPTSVSLRLPASSIGARSTRVIFRSRSSPSRLLKVSGLRGDRRTQTCSLVREVRVYDETIGSCDGCLGVERRGMETRSLGVDVSWSLSWHREDASWRKVR